MLINAGQLLLINPILKENPNMQRQQYTVKPVFRDHCHESPVLKDPQFWKKVLQFSVNESVTKDHLS